MAEDTKEEVLINEDEGNIHVGSEEEMKIQQAEEELNIKQKAEAENEDDKNEATVDPYLDEPSVSKPYDSDWKDIRDQDISQYLWDTFLHLINKGMKSLNDKIINSANAGIGRHDRGPVDPQATKEQKMKHTAERAKDLYTKAKKEAARVFSASTDDIPTGVLSQLGLQDEREKFIKLIENTQEIAFESTISDFLHEKMKDKDFDFAKMETKGIINEVQGRILDKNEKLLSGVMATFYYSSNIEGLSSQETLKACENYLKIRERESAEIKDLILDDLEDGNIVANGKKPSKDITSKLNAYNQSFARDALMLPTAVREATALVDKNSLSSEEKIGLQKLAETENAFRIFENTTLADIKEQAKAIDEAIKRNKDNPARARIAAMKSKLGKNPVTAKMVQKYATNNILKAVNKKNGGRTS